MFPAVEPVDTSVSVGCQMDLPENKPGHDNNTSQQCYQSSPKDQAGLLTVNLYYVRHGQSEWNREAKTTWRESALNKKKHLRDAKLTPKGTAEARKLSELIMLLADKDDDWGLLSGKSDLRRMGLGNARSRKVAYATSNLRRASLTFFMAFKHLISTNKIDKLHILSALQEPAHNIDSNSLSTPHSAPVLSFGDSCPMKVDMDTTCNSGDEMRPDLVKKDTDEKLLGNFCRWMRNMAVFGHTPTDADLPSGVRTEPIITDFVVAGHSMFLRGFFKRYLSSKNEFKSLVEKKLSSTFSTVGNGSLIKVTIQLLVPFKENTQVPDTELCQILPLSARILDGQVHGRNFLNGILRSVKVDASQHIVKAYESN